MQLLIKAANWLGVAFTVVIAIGLLVIAVLSWLLKHHGPS